jgi:hypothetical protein
VSTRTLRPWTDLVRLHPDVEAGTFTEAMFAIDLGAIAAGDPNVPVVNREAREFFRATYLTADLRRLLVEVLGSLAGQPGYNRVLKLRTPFGGGKSHTLAALLHAARDRRALDEIPQARDFPDPGRVAVAVFDGEKFDARNGKALEGGRTIQTMWGWIAWQIDPDKAFPLVEGHDRDRVAPGGDVIREVLTRGANGRPVLVLLDEVLKYMERAAAVAVLVRRRVTELFRRHMTAPPATSFDILPRALTSGKLYEAYVLALVSRELTNAEGYQLRLVNSEFLPLQSTPQPIDRQRPRVELRTSARCVAEMWTDIEFLSLSFSMRRGGSPERGEYHELDVAVVDPGLSGRPPHDRIWLAVECKNTGYHKELGEHPEPEGLASLVVASRQVDDVGGAVDAGPPEAVD